MDGEYAVTHLSMSDTRRAVKGSPTRDTFKQLHKSCLPRHLFAVDADLALVEKAPFGTVALLDVKCGRDSVSFTEVIFYNDLLRYGIPVFIVQANNEDDLSNYRVTVSRYAGGDPRPNPPTYKLIEPVALSGFEQYAAWENALRAAWKRNRATAAPTVWTGKL